jgi:2-amino-4-hydroxy-6-hydroxymethyldihydropteridine diphosphokinase
VSAPAIAIGLGGNVGGEAAVLARFRDARAALANLGAVRSARLYRTAPIGPPQPAYLNTAVSLLAPDMLPAELVETLLELERLLGRDRAAETRWGPRAIDLDVLLWGDRTIDHRGPPALEVPHPRLGDRRFALLPLIDLYGDARLVPGRDVTLGALVARLPAQGILDLGDW